jgi:hypothetical protein
MSSKLRMWKENPKNNYTYCVIRSYKDFKAPVHL